MRRLHTSNLARKSVVPDEESLNDLRRRFRSGNFMRYVVRPVSLAILITSVLVGFLSLIVEVTFDERWYSWTPLLFLVTLEAVYTTNWLHDPERLSLDRSAYRGAELLLIFVAVRLASWIIFDEGLPDVNQLLTYLRNPFSLFLIGRFFVSLLLALIGWRLAVGLSQIFSDLEVSEFELRYYSLPLAKRKALSDDQPIYAARSQMVKNFGSFWIWGGILLAIAVGLSTLDIRSLALFKNPLAISGFDLEPRHLMILLVYFILGFWLLSQAKLLELNARWLINGISKDQGMDARWQRVTLAVLVLVGVGAAFLPAGPTPLIGRIISSIVYMILVLVNLLILLVYIPVGFFLSLFSRGSMNTVPPPPRLPPETLAAQGPDSLSSMGQTIMMVLSSAIWTLLIVGIVVALLFFFRERRSTVENNVLATFWSQVKLYLATIWTRLRHRASMVRLQIPVRFRTPSKDTDKTQKKPRWRFIRVGGLSPRDQLRYFYLSTVRRASDQGVERKSAETPLEFSQDLRDNWPDIEQEVETLTNAFLKARYSDASITEEDIPEVKDTWKGVRRQIRKGAAADDDDLPPEPQAE